MLGILLATQETTNDKKVFGSKGKFKCKIQVLLVHCGMWPVLEITVLNVTVQWLLAKYKSFQCHLGPNFKVSTNPIAHDSIF